MLLTLLLAAFAIDVATWYQKHHQAQVAADAAALAAANCLANEASTNTAANSCTTATDTTRASAVATSIAQSNNVPIESIGFSTTTTGTVTSISGVSVTTAQGAPTFFAHLAGISTPTARASAAATASQTPGECTGDGCLLFYAAGSSCSSPSISIQVGNSDTFNGGILTNGSVDDSKGNGGNFNGAVNYGSGATCQSDTTFKNGATFTDGAPAQQTTDRGSTASPNWLIDYSAIFPACGAGSTFQYQCTGPGGTPSYCTNASTASSVTPSSNGIWCAVGTTGTASTPSTWTGAVNAPTSGSFTMIGATVTLSNNTSLSAYSHNLIAYAVSASGSAFTANGGNLTWTGDVFAPNGGVAINNGNVNFTGFIQAQTISDKGGDQHGGGPAFTSGQTVFPGQDSLSQ
jgi:hypothetical protein